MNGVAEVEGVTDSGNEGKAFVCLRLCYCSIIFLWFYVHVLSNLTLENFISAKGVPDFWLTAMKTNEILAAEVGIYTLYINPSDNLLSTGLLTHTRSDLRK